MKLQALLFSAVLLLHWPGIVRGGPDPCLTAAQNLFNLRSWNASITEYKRYLFFNDQSPLRGQCYEKMSLCYQELGDFERALDTTYRSAQFASIDSVIDEHHLRAGTLLEKMEDWASAEIEFAHVQANSTHRALRKRATLRLAQNQLRGHRWGDARISLSREDDFLNSTTIDSIFAPIETVSQKSPNTARRLSTFLPGAGQVYDGYVIQGVHSFAINFVLGALLVRSIETTNVGLTLISGSLLARFYQGGRYHAARLASERNTRELQPVVERTIRELRRRESELSVHERCVDTVTFNH